MQRFWTTAELRALGKTDRRISAAASAGRLIPVRIGWWARPGTAQELIRAVRVGGVATAHTAARARGLWTPPDAASPGGRRGSPPPRPVLHVAVPSTSARSRLRDPDDPRAPLGPREDVVLCWVAPGEVRAGGRDGLAGVLPMLRDLFRLEEEPERALAVVESALRNRHLREVELAALSRLLPGRLAHVPALAEASAHSGIETIMRVRLRAMGLRVEPQATIAGVGHGDLLVEGRLLVEVDGREWHDDAVRFEEDRRRDLVAALGRDRVLRFSWYQVLFRWEEVEAAILAALAM